MTDEISRYVLEKAKRDPGVQRVVRDARTYAEFVEHPGWLRLVEEYGAKREAAERALTKRLLRGEKISEHEQGFNAGWLAALAWFIHRPEKAMAELEQAARWAYTTSQLMEQQAEGEDAPYE